MITGAAQGIGKELANTFSQKKAQLVLVDLPDKFDCLQTVSEELTKQYGVSVKTYALDISNCEMISEVVSKMKDDSILVDVLINNAGQNSYCDAINITEELWDSVVNVNLKGTFFLTKEIANLSIIDRRGNIICIASQHGVVGNFQRAHYCSSKAGIINMVRALAIEWSKYDVRVNCISPTFVITEDNSAILNDVMFKKNGLQKIPLKRYATPKDIAYAALFLAGPMANMITGHNLLVDGGWTAC